MRRSVSSPDETQKRVENTTLQRSIFDELQGVSSGALCRMLDITSQTT